MNLKVLKAKRYFMYVWVCDKLVDFIKDMLVKMSKKQVKVNENAVMVWAEALPPAENNDKMYNKLMNEIDLANDFLENAEQIMLK